MVWTPHPSHNIYDNSFPKRIKAYIMIPHKANECSEFVARHEMIHAHILDRGRTP